MAVELVKVLAIDGEPGILDIIQKALALRKGFEVFTSSDATEAMEIFQRERPDICVIELYQTGCRTGIDGLAVLRKVKRLNPDCECLMLTFFDTPAKVIFEAHMAGFTAEIRRSDGIVRSMPAFTKLAYLILERRKLQAAQTIDEIESRLNNIFRFKSLAYEYFYYENLKRLFSDLGRCFIIGRPDD